MPPPGKNLLSPLQRIHVWYALLLLIFIIFLIRLFYLQIIKYDHYKNVALNRQLKEYEIPAERGIIEAQYEGESVPIVLNEAKYTLFADPKFVEDAGSVAEKIHSILGGKSDDYKYIIENNRSLRYVILAKKLSRSQKEAIENQELKGVGTREALYRTYPQGTLAAQVLGFVDDEGNGRYGIEQALDEQLKGRPGQLRAITDARGIPLAANKDNVITQPESGDRIVLTIDLGMQRQLENILKTGIKRARANSGGAVILDVRTGAVKAMANYPTYNPAEFYKVETKDIGRFENNIVSAPLEVGSIMKPLTLAAALDLGVVNRNTSYNDPGSFVVDGARITNVEESGGAGRRVMADILQQSLNTGATWLLMQMGGGEINKSARQKWHSYMTDHYQLGKPTGIEQGYEGAGSIPDPNKGFGLNIQFANTSFGQGMTATPLQMASALVAVLNGGTYYQPHLVDKVINHNGREEVKKPQIISNQVVKPEISKTIGDLMQYVFEKNHHVYGMPNLRTEFSIGSKTGTAQIPKPGGGYYEDRFNGMFMGFVGGNTPEYVIVVRVNEPKIAGYAGSTGAGPVFVGLANMLIDNFGVTPKRQN